MSISLNKRHGTCLVEGLKRVSMKQEKKSHLSGLKPNKIRKVHLILVLKNLDGKLLLILFLIL